MSLDALRRAAHAAAAIQQEADTAGLGRPEARYERALDALADETRRRQDAEDRAGRRAALLRQCLPYLADAPALRAAVEEELGGTPCSHSASSIRA